MKLLLILPAVLALSACTTPRALRPAITDAELASLLHQTPSQARMVTLHFRVAGNRGQRVEGPIASYPIGPSNHLAEPKRVQTLPSLTVRPNQKGKIEIIREFIYPTRLDLPKLPGASAEVTPTTPTRFKTEDVGWSIDDITVISQGGFYMVHGRFLETTFDGFIDNPGEGFRPIAGPDGRLITDNRAQSPTFTKRETPFVVSALPGQTYRLPLHLRQSGATLEISCRGIDSSGQTLDRARP